MVAALTDTALPLAVTMALAGLGVGMLNPILSTVMYERIPESLRSRVSGVTTAGCELTMPLGGLAAGLLVDGFGIGTALLLFGGTFLLTTLAPLVFPAWRGWSAAGGGGQGGQQDGGASPRFSARREFTASVSEVTGISRSPSGSSDRASAHSAFGTRNTLAPSRRAAWVFRPRRRRGRPCRRRRWCPYRRCCARR